MFLGHLMAKALFFLGHLMTKEWTQRRVTLRSKPPSVISSSIIDLKWMFNVAAGYLKYHPACQFAEHG